MRASASRVLFAVACAVVGAGGALALSRGGDEKPAEKEKVAVAPVPSKGKADDAKWISSAPPSAFPDLVPPELERGNPKAIEKFTAEFEKRCPRLCGTIALKIDPTDDTLRKLLKARLHQGVREYQRVRQMSEQGGPNPNDIARDRDLIADIVAVVTELWAGQPKELALWLEELLIVSKESERYTRLRVEAGALHSRDLDGASRTRLKIEAELWKAKNAK